MRNAVGSAKAKVRSGLSVTTTNDYAKLPQVKKTSIQPAHRCQWAGSGHYYLICSCGAWNSKEHQERNRCYMCGKAIIRDAAEVASDIAATKLKLLVLEQELSTYDVSNQ